MTKKNFKSKSSKITLKNRKKQSGGAVINLLKTQDEDSFKTTDKGELVSLLVPGNLRYTSDEKVNGIVFGAKGLAVVLAAGGAVAVSAGTFGAAPAAALASAAVYNGLVAAVPAGLSAAGLSAATSATGALTAAAASGTAAASSATGAVTAAIAANPLAATGAAGAAAGFAAAKSQLPSLRPRLSILKPKFSLTLGRFETAPYDFYIFYDESKQKTILLVETPLDRQEKKEKSLMSVFGRSTKKNYLYGFLAKSPEQNNDQQGKLNVEKKLPPGKIVIKFTLENPGKQDKSTLGNDKGKIKKEDGDYIFLNCYGTEANLEKLKVRYTAAHTRYNTAVVKDISGNIEESKEEIEDLKKKLEEKKQEIAVNQSNGEKMQQELSSLKEKIEEEQQYKVQLVEDRTVNSLEGEHGEQIVHTVLEQASSQNLFSDLDHKELQFIVDALNKEQLTELFKYATSLNKIKKGGSVKLSLNKRKKRTRNMSKKRHI